MRYDHHIFDVGAFNGLDGIALALQNQKVMIHAFEANPSMIKTIKSNKKKIEDFWEKRFEISKSIIMLLVIRMHS